MIITVLNRAEAERASPDIILTHAIISIGEPEPRREGSPGPASFAENPWRRGILRVQFYDIDIESITNAGYIHEIQKSGGKGLMTDDHANQILDFVVDMKGKIELLICHCEGGISRSSATAAAILRILTGSDNKIFNDPRYIPNMFVYRKILNAWQERGGEWKTEE